jgi:hypothetical protein
MTLGEMLKDYAEIARREQRHDSDIDGYLHADPTLSAFLHDIVDGVALHAGGNPELSVIIGLTWVVDALRWGREMPTDLDNLATTPAASGGI